MVYTAWTKVRPKGGIKILRSSCRQLRNGLINGVNEKNSDFVLGNSQDERDQSAKHAATNHLGSVDESPFNLPAKKSPGLGRREPFQSSGKKMPLMSNRSGVFDDDGATSESSQSSRAGRPPSRFEFTPQGSRIASVITTPGSQRGINTQCSHRGRSNDRSGRSSRFVPKDRSIVRQGLKKNLKNISGT